MSEMYVQFADERQVSITAVFSCPQDDDIYPNQGVIGGDDPRYLAFTQPPEQVLPVDPLDKLKAFLLENPDVAEILK